jgi:hypothetical protein
VLGAGPANEARAVLKAAPDAARSGTGRLFADDERRAVEAALRRLRHEGLRGPGDARPAARLRAAAWQGRGAESNPRPVR